MRELKEFELTIFLPPVYVKGEKVSEPMWEPITVKTTAFMWAANEAKEQAKKLYPNRFCLIRPKGYRGLQ